MLTRLSAVAMIFAGSAGYAAPAPYIAADVGGEFTQSFSDADDVTRIATKSGVFASGAVGLRLSHNLRVEVEGRYGHHAIDSIHTRRDDDLLDPLASVHGSERETAVTVNALFDLPFRVARLAPYIGAGAGYGWLDFGHAGGLGKGMLVLADNNRVTGPLNVTFGHSNAFAYQLRAGAAYAMSPKLAVTVEYRFEGLSHASVPVLRTAATGLMVNGALASVQTDNRFAPRSQAAMIGIRFRV